MNTASPLFSGEIARNENFKKELVKWLIALIRKKKPKKKLYRKHHLIFTSKDLYDGFNLLIFMAQYEDDIIIDDTIIEYTGNFFIYHIKCSYNLPLNLDIYKNQNGTVIDVFFTKGVEAIEASDIF